MKKKVVIIVVILGMFLITGGYFIYREYNFKMAENMILEAGKLYYEKNPEFLPQENGDVKEVSLKTLRNKSLVEDILFSVDKDRCSDESIIRVVKMKDEIKYYTYLVCKNKKSDFSIIPKEIKIDSENIIILGKGEKLTYPSVLNKSDFIEETIKTNIKESTSEIDNFYSIEYTAYDKNYNRSSKVVEVYTYDTLESEMSKKLGSRTSFTGLEKGNFIRYSNMLWQITGVNPNGSYRAISRHNVKTMALGSSNGSYKNSNVDKWLNTEFYSLLNKPEKYLVEGNWCIYSSLNYNDEYKCQDDNYYKANVAILNSNDFNKTLDDNGYSFVDSLYVMHVMTNGNVNNNTITVRNNIYYGNSTTDTAEVKPVINFNKNQKIIGKGTASEPYQFIEEYSEYNSKTKVSEIKVGETLIFSNAIYIVDEVFEDSLSIVMLVPLQTKKGLLTFDFDSTYDEEKLNEDGEMLNFLNTEFLKILDESRLIKKKYEISIIEDTEFNYRQEETKNEYYVFAQNYDDIFNVTGYESNLWGPIISFTTHEFIKTEKVGYAFHDNYGFLSINTMKPNIGNFVGVKPKITIKNFGNITGGEGTFMKPYEID